MTDLPGDLVRSRVVDDMTPVLETVLTTEFTGHIAIEPGDAILLDDDDRAILATKHGIPHTAYHAGIDRGGTAALTALSGAGPYRTTLYACDPEAIDTRSPGAPINPGEPADILTQDQTLLRRTRDHAPDTDNVEEPLDAVEAFLNDAETVTAIQHQAREEAQRRATEWNLRPE